MTYYILYTITYIISYLVPISCLLSCSGYTLMLYYSFLTYYFIIYFLIRSCIVIYFAFAFTFNSMIHFDYKIDIHDRFERESRYVCHSVAM